MGYPDGYTDLDTETVDTANRYPAAWLDGSWEDDTPMLTTRKKHRKNRLKALGNAVVPQITAYLWGLIAGALCLP
jgi:hypothetical protein